MITVADLELHADALDRPETISKAAAIYNQFGALVVRGLMKPYAEQIRQDIELAAAEALALYDQAEKIPEGWRTPDGTLWLPAPANYSRDKQIMVLACNYKNSAASFLSAIDPKLLDIIETIL